MDPMYRIIFVLSLIIGCFIQLPVRMLPASAGDVDHFIDRTQYPYVNSLAELNIVKGASVPETDNRSKTRIEHDSTVRFQSEPLIGSHSAISKPFREVDNRAKPLGHPDFYTDLAPTGIKVAINPDIVRPVQPPNNEGIDEYSMNNRLNRVNDRLVNLSKNLNALKTTSYKHSLDTLTVDSKNIIVDEQSNDQHNSALIPPDRTMSFQNIDRTVQTDTVRDNSSVRATHHKQHVRQFLEGEQWSANVDRECPGGFSDRDIKQWRYNARHLEVVKIENGCGSMQNRLITFNDSSKACARFRLNTDLMQGDIYSYYLGQLLGIKHTPPTVLLKADKNSKQWRPVADEIVSARWTDQKPVILSQWIDDLTPVHAPSKLRDQTAQLTPNLIKGETQLSEICSLAQWSDLIIHDYLTANLDRVVNNLYNLRWNPNMMQKPIHNLEKTSASGQFVYLDNESGLFHGYRLLDTNGQFHRTLLDSTCVFRKSTIATIERLYTAGNIGERLMDLYRNNEELHSLLPRIPNKNMDVLQLRLDDVYKQMIKCKHLYSGH